MEEEEAIIDAEVTKDVPKDSDVPKDPEVPKDETKIPEVVDEEISIKQISILDNKISKLLRDDERIYHDDLDDEVHPSYSKFCFPYQVKCRIRYSNEARKYNRILLKQLKDLETYQMSAYEAARFNRHFGITTLWPPLHNCREIDYFLEKFFVHSPADTKRLRYLLREVQT